MTGHLLDAAVRRAGDLVAAKGAVEVEEDAGLRWSVSDRQISNLVHCTHVVGLVERGGGSASRDSGATTRDHNVDALQLLARSTKARIAISLT